MKIHPAPGNCNISLPEQARATSCRRKKLRRLPHIFEKVLELPFHSDADVSMEETPDSISFTTATNGIASDVRADAIEIYTGVTKIVLRGIGIFDSSGTEFELDLWRFRLPACTRPELASASYNDGELVVTVPKGAEGEEEEEEGDVGAGSLVLVL